MKRVTEFRKILWIVLFAICAFAIILTFSETRWSRVAFALENSSVEEDDCVYRFKLIEEDGTFIGYINSCECNNSQLCECISQTETSFYTYEPFNFNLFKSSFMAHYKGKPGYHIEDFYTMSGEQFGWAEPVVPYLGPSGEIEVIVKFATNTHSIVFNANGGTAVSNKTVIYGTNVDLPTTSKTGYDFVGWDISGTCIDAGSSFSVPALPNEQVILANAVWSAKTYTITFDSDGGESIEPQSVVYGEGFNLPIPSKTLYEFVGWKLPDGTTVTSGDNWSIADNVTLTAVWLGKSFNIVYHSNRNVALNNPQTIRYNQEVALSNGDFTITENSYTVLFTYSFKTIYTFEGWYYDHALTQPYTGILDPPFGIDNDTIHLYAKHSISNEATLLYVGVRQINVPSYVSGIEIKEDLTYPIKTALRTDPLTIYFNNADLKTNTTSIYAPIESEYLTITVSGNNEISGGAAGEHAIYTNQLEFVFLADSYCTVYGASGADGVDGVAGTDGAAGVWDDGKHGQDGTAGSSGTDGIAGGHGIRTSILKITQSDDECHLLIGGGNGGDGGNGGKGGNGGRGSDAGSITKMAGHGGKGGNGGNGGNGAAPGKGLSFTPIVINNAGGATNIVIIVDGQGGDGGSGGAGGSGGRGGDSTIVWNKGNAGANGANGADGKSCDCSMQLYFLL